MRTELHKDGDCMGVVTSAATEDEFIGDFSRLLEALIDTAEYGGDWLFQLQRWLPAMVDICCKYRGYNSQVQERRVFSAGAMTPRNPVVGCDEGEMIWSYSDEFNGWRALTKELAEASRAENMKRRATA